MNNYIVVLMILVSILVTIRVKAEELDTQATASIFSIYDKELISPLSTFSHKTSNGVQEASEIAMSRCETFKSNLNNSDQYRCVITKIEKQ